MQTSLQTFRELKSSRSFQEEVDTYGVTATVEVLFAECSETWTKDFETFRSGRSLKLLGFDTLDGKNWKNASAAEDDVKMLESWLEGIPTTNADPLRSNAEEIIIRSQCLKERVGEVLEAHGYSDGDALSFDQCENLVKAGVVVELLLLPLSRLRDVARWGTERNII